MQFVVATHAARLRCTTTCKQRSLNGSTPDNGGAGESGAMHPFTRLLRWRRALPRVRRALGSRATVLRGSLRYHRHATPMEQPMIDFVSMRQNLSRVLLTGAALAFPCQAALAAPVFIVRSGARRVGKECVSPC